MRWLLASRNDNAGRVIADRHYNRQKVGAPGFVPPGRCVVLRSVCGRALWVTSWPFAEYVKHAWPGAWINSTFRNEDGAAGLSSELIREAIAATRSVWEPPALGLVTFVDASEVRRKRDPGRCYLRAGFRPATPRTTKAGLLAFQMLPDEMPAAAAPLPPRADGPLFEAGA